MFLSDISVSRESTKTTVSALVDGRSLYFAFAGAPKLGDLASALLACCIYPAMVVGVPVTLDKRYMASSTLIANLETFQSIYQQWWPGLSRVTIDARQGQSPVSTQGYEGSMFSGGVDSFYTYLCNEERIQRLVFAGGLDIPADESDRFDQSVKHYSQFANSRGKELVTLWTNIKGFWPGVEMMPHHGQVLAAFGIMLGFSTTFIPASHTYLQLDPWGSHPMSDPLFSTEATITVHHGAIPRREKIRLVGFDEQCMSMLRVCNSSDQYNCGICEKCLRTRMSIRLLRLSSDALEPLDTLKPIRSLRLYSDSDLTFWQDNLALARETGDREAARAIRSVVRGYELRRTFGRVRTLIRTS